MYIPGITFSTNLSEVIKISLRSSALNRAKSFWALRSILFFYLSKPVPLVAKDLGLLFVSDFNKENFNFCWHTSALENSCLLEPKELLSGAAKTSARLPIAFLVGYRPMTAVDPNSVAAWRGGGSMLGMHERVRCWWRKKVRMKSAVIDCNKFWWIFSGEYRRKKSCGEPHYFALQRLHASERRYPNQDTCYNYMDGWIVWWVVGLWRKFWTQALELNGSARLSSWQNNDTSVNSQLKTWMQIEIYFIYYFWQCLV